MYAATVKEQRLNFTVSGMLWQRSLVMQDLETGSLWSHILGRAMRGPLEGTDLEVIPSVLTTWKSWKAEYPNTSVLAMTRTAAVFDEHTQKRPGKFLLGVVLKGKAQAYPFDRLMKSRVINDNVAGSAVVVTFNPETTAARIYSSIVEDRSLTFQPLEDEQMKDEETASTWSSSTGECLAGDLKGTTLQALPGIVSFVEAWKQFHPDSDYFGKGWF